MNIIVNKILGCKWQTASTLHLSEIQQKMQRCCNNVYDGLENVYYVLVNRNVAEMYANCGFSRQP